MFVTGQKVSGFDTIDGPLSVFFSKFIYPHYQIEWICHPLNVYWLSSINHKLHHMKKTTLTAIAAVTVLVLLSLSFRKSVTAVNLTAPTGQRIAASVQSLKAESVQLISHKHGSVAFEIISVSYLPVKQGYAAIVSYRLQNGITGSYGIFAGVPLQLPNQSALNVEAREGKVKITCEGTCTCHLSVTINSDTGVITVECGCSSCSAQISQV